MRPALMINCCLLPVVQSDFSYDLGRLISQLPTTAVRDIDLPEMDIEFIYGRLSVIMLIGSYTLSPGRNALSLDCHEILTLILTNLDRK